MTEAGVTIEAAGAAGGGSVVRFAGPMLAADVSALRDRLRALPDGPVTLDLGKAGEIDTAGAWLVVTLRRRLAAEGIEARVEGANPKQALIIETVEKANTAEKLINIGETRGNTSTGLMLSGDQNIVDVKFSVAYQVSDPVSYLFNVSDPDEMVRQVAESAMREAAPRTASQENATSIRIRGKSRRLPILSNTISHTELARLADHFQSISRKYPISIEAPALDEWQEYFKRTEVAWYIYCNHRFCSVVTEKDSYCLFLFKLFH